MANLKVGVQFDASDLQKDIQKAVKDANTTIKGIKPETIKPQIEIPAGSINALKAQLKDLTAKRNIAVGVDLSEANKAIQQTKSKIKELESEGKKSGGFFAGNFLGNIQALSVAGAGLAIAGVLKDAAVAGIKFEKTLASVSALTGVTGTGLTDLSNRAIEIARAFGTEASDQLLVFKNILSKLGPDIAKTPEALDSLARSAATLSKATGDTAEASIGALTDSLLQFQVPLDDASFAAAKAAEFMNVLAAGAKEGAAEVPQIAEAIKVAGVAASGANVSFVETNAALQALAAGGKQGAEAGTALRNVLGTLSKGEFIPKEAEEGLKRAGVNLSVLSDTTLPFTDRLRELKKIQADAALTAKLFGTENAAAASILIRSADAQDVLAQKITGTNAAAEQAAINQATIAAKMDKIAAFFSARMLQLFQDVQGFVVTVVDQITAIGNAIEHIPVIFNKVKAAITGFFSGIFEVFNQIAKEISNFSLGSIGKIIDIITNSLTTIGASTSAAVAGAIQQSGATAAPEIAKMSDDMAKRVGEGVDKINAQVKSKGLKNIDAIKEQFKTLKDSLGADAGNEAKNILFNAQNAAIALFKKINKDGSGGGAKKDDGSEKKRKEELEKLQEFLAKEKAAREAAAVSEEASALNAIRDRYKNQLESAVKNSGLFSALTLSIQDELNRQLEAKSAEFAVKRTEQGVKDAEDAAKRLADIEKDIAKQSGEDQFEARRKEAERERDMVLNNVKATEAEKIAAKKRFAGIENKINVDKGDAELGNAIKVAGALQGLFGEQTAIYKAAAIAQTTIETYKAAVAALAPPPTGAGPLFGPILAGITIASGLATVSKIAGISIPTFAKGTEYITGQGAQRGPTGGYIVEAHEGEAILTREENKRRRSDTSSLSAVTDAVRELNATMKAGISTDIRQHNISEIEVTATGRELKGVLHSEEKHTRNNSLG